MFFFFFLISLTLLPSLCHEYVLTGKIFLCIAELHLGNTDDWYFSSSIVHNTPELWNTISTDEACRFTLSLFLQALWQKAVVSSVIEYQNLLLGSNQDHHRWKNAEIYSYTIMNEIISSRTLSYETFKLSLFFVWKNNHKCTVYSLSKNI